jgi:hypothetical protein
MWVKMKECAVIVPCKVVLVLLILFIYIVEIAAAFADIWPIRGRNENR